MPSRIRRSPAHPARTAPGGGRSGLKVEAAWRPRPPSPGGRPPGCRTHRRNNPPARANTALLLSVLVDGDNQRYQEVTYATPTNYHRRHRPCRHGRRRRCRRRFGAAWRVTLDHRLSTRSAAQRAFSLTFSITQRDDAYRRRPDADRPSSRHGHPCRARPAGTLSAPHAHHRRRHARFHGNAELLAVHPGSPGLWC